VFCHFDPQPGWDKDKFSKQQFIRNRRFKLYADGRLFEVPRDLKEQHPITGDAETPESRQARAELTKALHAVLKPLK
jgi:hypothetical protein